MLSGEQTGRTGGAVHITDGRGRYGCDGEIGRRSRRSHSRGHGEALTHLITMPLGDCGDNRSCSPGVEALQVIAIHVDLGRAIEKHVLSDAGTGVADEFDVGVGCARCGSIHPQVEHSVHQGDGTAAHATDQEVRIGVPTDIGGTSDHLKSATLKNRAVAVIVEVEQVVQEKVAGFTVRGALDQCACTCDLATEEHVCNRS